MKRVWGIMVVALLMSGLVWAAEDEKKAPTVTVTGEVYAEYDEEGKNIVAGEVTNEEGVTYYIVLDKNGMAMLKALGDKTAKVTGTITEKKVTVEEEEMVEYWLTVKTFVEVKRAEPEEAADDGLEGEEELEAIK